VRYFYAIIFLCFIGYQFSDLYSNTVGIIISILFGLLSLPVYIYIKISFRKWENYLTTKQAFLYYFKCTCCLQKKYKLRKRQDISEQI